MRRVVFTQAARAELISAQDWYERESSGLGHRFLAAVDVAVQKISRDPQLFPAIYKQVRRALLRGFPYALLFVTEEDGTLTVIACFHGSRDPVRWRRRV